MERDRLADLLDGTSYASSACRHALLDGAEFIVWDGWAPADKMVPAYERREARALAGGIATLGFPEALEGLRRAGDQRVRLGQVTVTRPPYVFMVFLADDPAAVIACVGFDRQEVSPEPANSGR